MTTDQRFERLERQNRRLKRSVIGMAVAGLSLLVMGQTLPAKVHDVVKAKKFEVVRDDGLPMVHIGMFLLIFKRLHLILTLTQYGMWWMGLRLCYRMGLLNL